jgi:hypothetical protein
LRIIKVGNTSYNEDEQEKVYMHLLLINNKPIMYATMAPDAMTARALAELIAPIWDTFPVFETLQALEQQKEIGILDMGVDSNSVKM